jgi:aminopeptidase N
MEGLGRRCAALAALVWLCACAPAGAQASAGAAGAGDPLFPGLGNGGYDVRHYTLALRYASRALVQTVPGVVTVRARATQALSRFDLDFSGRSVEAVAVDGRHARFRRRGAELVVTPRRAIGAGRRFTVRVAFTSGPRAIPSRDAGSFDRVLAAAWLATPSGSITAAQPDGAHRIFPCDDVPSDPATFTIRATTPAGSTFVANGERTRRHTAGGRTGWTYKERRPMATELIQLAFGALTVRTRRPEHGVRLRDVAPTRSIRRLEPALARVRGHLDFMVAKVGRFPFSTYGSLFSDGSFPFALEDETLSLYPSSLFDGSGGNSGDPRFYAPVMVHELAHQWFGDDVMPARWSDVWLNEGHATWYEWEYAAEHGDGLAYLGGTFTEAMRAAYEEADSLRARFGPVAAPRHGAGDLGKLFSDNVYEGGALVLYALRQVVGDATFRRIERLWPRRFGGRPASTADFIALASAVARRDLRPFLGAWLYGTKTPPMPGHPDWTAAARRQARTTGDPDRTAAARRQTRTTGRW